jgi:hypothetical protein
VILHRLTLVAPLVAGGHLLVGIWRVPGRWRSCVEVTAQLLQADGKLLTFGTHYPGWMLNESHPEPELTLLSLGPSDLYLLAPTRLATFRIAVHGFGLAANFTPRRHGDQKDAPRAFWEVGRARTLFGLCEGDLAVAGVRATLDGPAFLETCTIDLRDVSGAPFGRTWGFLPGTPGAAPETYFATSRPAPARELCPEGYFWRVPVDDPDDKLAVDTDPFEHPLTREGTCAEVRTAPLIGALPFSWSLERWWRKRGAPAWQVTLRTLHAPVDLPAGSPWGAAPGAVVGLQEEWSLAP